jgi:DNA-binding protein HU-beta
MTKAELVNHVAKSTGVDRAVVLEVVEAMTGTIKEAMGKKENVYLRGFGSFIVKTRAAKTARNITKNTTITVPAHDVAAFKPARELANAVREKAPKC